MMRCAKQTSPDENTVKLARAVFEVIEREKQKEDSKVHRNGKSGERETKGVQFLLFLLYLLLFLTSSLSECPQ
jgi:hypothetical protein